MAPYLIQWTAIQEGKSRGCAIYDFLWISPPGVLDHSLEGVSIFKERFWGNPREIWTKNLYILGHIQYTLFRFFRFVKKMVTSQGV
jgi:lipid II:glycine glycyltransferase (peptidoglycan interpeptide bridge formation enzyme)